MMKKIFFLIILISNFSHSQEWKVNEKSVTGVFNSTKTKSELFALINKWISLNYNSAKNVIQLSDAESGTIIIKGINELFYTSNSKVIMKSAPEKAITKFNHIIEINIKDNKFRIIYTITDIINQENSGFNSLFFNCINLNGDNSSAVQQYNDESEKYLKQGLIGKEKREKFKSATIEMFKEINKNLSDSMKTILLSIEKAAKDDNGW